MHASIVVGNYEQKKDLRTQKQAAQERMSNSLINDASCAQIGSFVVVIFI
jgi:hypothetical protein